MNFPFSTYRIQLNSKFTFKELKEIIGYLHQLGISTIYAAPVTTSVTHSSHGYDVTDASAINPEIGTIDEIKELSAELKRLSMTWLQDIVPNHMAFSDTNQRLTDVLERGQCSQYQTYFDINWNHQNPTLKGKIMVPVLGNELNECLEKGEIKLVFDEKGFNFNVYDQLFPLSISAYPVLMPIMGRFITSENYEQELLALIDKSKTLNLEEWIEYKHNFLLIILNFIDKKLTVNQTVDLINADKTLLNELLQNQYYLLTSWKTSEKEMNYRRFFTVNSLICLRMEDETVFDEYHSLIASLYNNSVIHGVRIDHIDGLYHPQQYVERLRNLLGKDCYIIAEKILEYNEDISKDWDLQGTSGYEFLSFTNRLLTDKQGAKKLFSFYQELVSDTKQYTDLVFENKLNFLNSQMGGELENLMCYLEELELLKDTLFKRNALKRALGIFMAAFPVYRIYPDHFPLSAESFQIINTAFEKAALKADELSNELKWLRQLFEQNQLENDVKSDQTDKKILFIMRLMQFTGPLAAKGVEDTTFYVYNPLISHNEVGDSPEELGISIEEFHDKMLSRKKNNPYSLNATSTHDTKRGEDARMRINVLAELADEWIDLVNVLNNITRPFIQQINGKQSPSVNDTYFMYQSLLGSFPENLQVNKEFIDRSMSFIIKALREAKTETTYGLPNKEYEEACTDFIFSILQEESAFLKSFIPFVEKIIHYASAYSLMQTVIKITVPGIPDIYQGCELWELSYVDPDNRRPVDYIFRQELFKEIIRKDQESREAVLLFTEQKRKEGAEKLFVTWKMLTLRREHNDMFLYGDYIPLTITNGERNAVAYARNYKQDWMVVILPLGLAKSSVDNEHWQNKLLQLPKNAPQQWINHFTEESITGENISLAQVFSQFPIAVLLYIAPKI